MKTLLATLILIGSATACGKTESILARPASGSPSQGWSSTSWGSLDDSQCLDLGSCSGSDVPGYQCAKQRLNQSDSPQFDFQGHTCMVISNDMQLDPGCDPIHPTDSCMSAWNTPIPCCAMTYGPGPKMDPPLKP